MAIKTISAWEARRNLGKLMDEVAIGNCPVIVESHGTPKVAFVPMKILEAWEARRDRLFSNWEAIADRVDLPEDEAMRIADEAVIWARAAKADEAPGN